MDGNRCCEYTRGIVKPCSASAVDSLLADLNPPQREAVCFVEGPLLILAGPGSGKTRVVTRRAAYLALTVCRPTEILAITFTNKAANEMRERIDALGAAEGMTVCTFHALCAKLLRWHHDRAGVPRNFTIFDRDDRRRLLKDAICDCGYSPMNYPPAMMEHKISQAKNSMLTAGRFQELHTEFPENAYGRIYARFEELMQQMDALDFDDLLMRMAMLLESDEVLREQMENQFRFVMVDEYQDTNAAQYRIARQLTRDRRNLCATGDPDQSIYGWRGADIGNILSFEQDYADARVVRLEQNYRSTKKILSAAKHLIEKNRERKAKSLWTENQTGPALRIWAHESGEEEAALIADEISARLRDGIQPGEIAVFYRINSLSRALEEALFRAGVKYQIARGVEFYNRKEIKDVLAYLRVMVNPHDEVSLLRIINVPPRGIGTTTVERLAGAARQRRRPIQDVLEDPASLNTMGRSAAKVAEFAALMRQLRSVLDLGASAALEYVLAHSGLRAFYGGEEEIDSDAAKNLDELISAASSFEAKRPGVSIVDWLEYAALISDVDSVQGNVGRVTLMTLHAAKGLEFDEVYIIGLENGLLPFRRARDDFDAYEGVIDEEERRLCFVGITRARQRITLSHARYRMMRGRAERTIRSPFLDELPEGEIEWISPQFSDENHSSASPEQRHADCKTWNIGTLVRHPVEGLGSILAIQRGSRRTHIEVQFRSGRRLTWVAEFADLETVDYNEVDDLE